MDTSEKVPGCLAAAEKAVTSLLNALTSPEGPEFRHSSSNYAAASLVGEIEDDLLRLDSIMATISSAKTWLYHWKE